MNLLNLDIEDLPWGILIYLTIATLIVGVTTFVFSDKTTTGYSLASVQEINLGNSLELVKEINNFPDQTILLPDSISIYKAISIVDSLNKLLK